MCGEIKGEPVKILVDTGSQKILSIPIKLKDSGWQSRQELRRSPQTLIKASQPIERLSVDYKGPLP